MQGRIQPYCNVNVIFLIEKLMRFKLIKENLTFCYVLGTLWIKNPCEIGSSTNLKEFQRIRAKEFTRMLASDLRAL